MAEESHHCRSTGIGRSTSLLPCPPPSLQGQGELLRGQIVQSPHKIQALLCELAAAVERERACVADAGGWLVVLLAGHLRYSFACWELWFAQERWRGLRLG